MYYFSDHLPCLSFFLYSIRVTFFLWYPHWVTSLSLLLVSNHFPCACLRFLWVSCIIPIVPSIIYVVIFFSIGSFGHCGFCLRRLFEFLPLPASVIRVSSDTLRLHNSACSTQIWSSFYINCVDRFMSVVVISVNTESRDSVSDAKFMKVYSISPCLSLLVLSYPSAPAVCSSSSLSSYPYWKCALKRTYVNSLSVMLFHVQYACVYSCVAGILEMPMSAIFRY